MIMQHFLLNMNYYYIMSCYYIMSRISKANNVIIYDIMRKAIYLMLQDFITLWADYYIMNFD